MTGRRRWFSSALNRWARKRHGEQPSPVVLNHRKIYILPSLSGMIFALMLLVMLLGSMNYNNSMGLGLAFLLGSLMLVIMHHCHRNLLGLRITYSLPEPIFAGDFARICVNLHNDHQQSRSDLVVRLSPDSDSAINVASRQMQATVLDLPTQQRGYLSVPRLHIRTRYPAGLFRSWTWVYWNLSVLVYPAARGDQPLPVISAAERAGLNARARGDEELAELRAYVPGDALNHVAWKHYARTGDLHSKTFDGPISRDQWLDYASVHRQDPEAKLEQLCAWVVQCHNDNIPFGLKLPGQTIHPDHSDSHRDRCLSALALHA